MKTFARLIRRYVLATAGIILVVVALLLGMTIYAGVPPNFTKAPPQVTVPWNWN